MLTADEASKLSRMQRMLDAAYAHYFTYSNGICKSAEGVISVSTDTFFDRARGVEKVPANPRLGGSDKPLRHRVTIYSSVFGSGNRMEFDSIDAALEGITIIHNEELAREYDAAGDPVGMWTW